MISIIIPTYNSAPTLGKTLESIYQNDFKDFEVIVIDDGSTDHTGDLVKNSLYPVVYEKLKTNRGAAFARNRGARLAQGEILLFVDADVEVKPNLLSLVDHEFKATNYDVVTGPFSSEPKIENNYLLFISSLSNYNFSKADFAFSTHLAAMRKKIFEEVNGFDERFPGAIVEDFDLYHRLIVNGYKCKTNMHMDAYHNHNFTFYTLFRRMFKFGFWKTPLILKYSKYRQVRNQPRRYLFNKESVLSYILFLLLPFSLYLALRTRSSFVFVLWVSAYALIKLEYLKSLRKKHLLMLLLGIVNDGVVLAGCFFGAFAYCKDLIIKGKKTSLT